MKTLNLSPEEMKEEISALKSQLAAYEAGDSNKNSSILIGDDQSLSVQYFLLSTHSPDPVLLSRTDNFQFVMVNDRAMEIYGYTEEEFLKMSIFDVEVMPPTLEEVRELYDSTPVGKIMEVTGRNKRKDGSTFPVDVRFSKISDEFALAFIRDVTAREEAADLLKISEERFRNLYTHMPIPYIAADMEGNITASNDRVHDLLGYSEEELSTKMIFDLYSDGPAGRKKMVGINARLLAGENISGEEVEIVRSDGELRWISLSVELDSDGSGRRATLEDITARKQAEAALQRYNHELESQVALRTEELTKTNKK